MASVTGVSFARWTVARLTNRSLVAADLGLATDATSEQVVDAAFDRWGSAAASRLRGAWATARVDPATAAVTIWRDALGVQPAYWAWGRSGALHIDESAARIATTGDVDTSLDPEFALADSIHGTGLLPSATPAVGIRRVPPGSWLRPADGCFERWWRPEDVRSLGRIPIEEATESLRALLVTVTDDAVLACAPDRTGTSSGVGAHLSGGMDSTLVAMVGHDALRSRGTGLACVASWSPSPDALPWAQVPGKQPTYDERDLIEQIAGDLGVPVLFGSAQMVDAPWLASADPAVQPASTLRAESHLLPQYGEFGTHHVLSGWGGDEFASFNGRGTLRAIGRGLRVGALRDSYRQLRSVNRSSAWAAWRLLQPALPNLRWRAHLPEFVRRGDTIAAAAASRFPDFVEARTRMQRRLAMASSPRAVQLALIDNGHLTRRVESWHAAGLRFGVSYHYPLLDERLVEWALSMPPEVFRVGQHSRRVFRLAIAGLVPDHIRVTAKEDPVLLRLVALDRQRQREQRAVAGDG